MKISVIVIGVVLAVSQLAAAQDASNRVFDGKALADGQFNLFLDIQVHL